MKHLESREQRLAYVNWDYNSPETAPDLTGLRHRAFIPGGGTTLEPEVVFLLKSPTFIESRATNIYGGIHYRLLTEFCQYAGIPDFYATYLVKYEMEKDRLPTALEASCALEYVREEIGILDPVVVVLVGEDMHYQILPTFPYVQTTWRLMQGKRALYATVPDIMLARRNENAYSDMQDEFQVLRLMLDCIASGDGS
jgi:uracil-DNA glycosylase family 4